MSGDVPTKPSVGPTVLTEADGSFKRKPSTFRNTIERGGKFEPEKGQILALQQSIRINQAYIYTRHAGRYHLYVSYGCREPHTLLQART